MYALSPNTKDLGWCAYFGLNGAAHSLLLLQAGVIYQSTSFHRFGIWKRYHHTSNGSFTAPRRAQSQHWTVAVLPRHSLFCCGCLGLGPKRPSLTHGDRVPHIAYILLVSRAEGTHLLSFRVPASDFLRTLFVTLSMEDRSQHTLWALLRYGREIGFLETCWFYVVGGWQAGTNHSKMQAPSVSGIRDNSGQWLPPNEYLGYGTQIPDI